MPNVVNVSLRGTYLLIILKNNGILIIIILNRLFFNMDTFRLQYWFFNPGIFIR